MEKVKVGGLVFILVPAYMEAWTKMDTQVGHCRRYTPHSLRFMARGHSVSLLAEGEFDAIGYWFARLVSFWERKNTNKEDTSGALTPRQIKLYDALFLIGNPIVKVLHWLCGVKKSKNRWILVKKLG